MRTFTPILTLTALLSSSLVGAPARAQDMTGDVAPEPPQSQTAQVNVRSGAPDLVIGVVKSRAIAASGNVVATGIGWDEQCTAPCTFKLKPGLRELVFRSPDLFATKELRIRSGENNIYVDPGNKGMRIGGNVLAALGVLALVGGGVILLTRSFLSDTDEVTGEPNKFRQNTKWALPVTIGGAVATAGGIALIYAGRVKIDEVGQAQAEMTLSARGTF